MFQNDTIDLIVYISSGLLAAGVFVKTGISIARFLRRVNTLVTQWIGNPELQIPGMVDRMEDHASRLKEIEGQLRPVQGKTIRERIVALERDVGNLRRQTKRNTRQQRRGTGVGGE